MVYSLQLASASMDDIRHQLATRSAMQIYQVSRHLSQRQRDFVDPIQPRSIHSNLAGVGKSSHSKGASMKIRVLVISPQIHFFIDLIHMLPLRSDISICSQRLSRQHTIRKPPISRQTINVPVWIYFHPLHMQQRELEIS